MAKKAKSAKAKTKATSKSGKKLMAKSAKKAAKTNKKAPRPSAGGIEEAIALLKADHRKVEELFEKFENAKGAGAKERLAGEICLELIVHAQIEEEVFYPAVKDVVDDDIYAEAHVEHDGAKMLIAEIAEGDPEDEFYDASVKVLSEMIKHHVHEEEMRDGMFAQARKSDGDFAELGARLAERKADLLALYKRNGLPRPKTRTLKTMPEIELGQPVG